MSSQVTFVCDDMRALSWANIVMSGTTPSRGAPQVNSTTTPKGNINTPQSSSTVDDRSPTGSTLSDFATNAASSSFRFRGDSRSVLRSLSGTPSRTLVIRSDPSMLTCFDPADKELYDLWAPKR